MKKTWIFPLLAVLAVTAVGAFAGEKEDQAREAALAWLALVDAGKYAESWDTAGPLFTERVEKDAWVTQVSGVRDPLGAVKERVLRSAHYTESLPGAPDGHYVILQFDSSFENKRRATETITPMLDDGEWKVVGYYIN